MNKTVKKEFSLEWSNHSWQLCWYHWKQLTHAFLSHSIFNSQLIILPLKSVLPFVQLPAGTHRPTWSKTVYCKHDKTCRKNYSSHWKGLLTWSKKISQNCTFLCINFCIKDSFDICFNYMSIWKPVSWSSNFPSFLLQERYKGTKMSYSFCYQKNWINFLFLFQFSYLNSSCLSFPPQALPL